MDHADSTERPEIRLAAVVLDCRDAAALADFYIRLLGWEKAFAQGDEFVDIVSPDGRMRIELQKNEDYVPPVWPEEEGRQQMMMHLDFSVQDAEHMALAVKHAIACGAAKAAVQYGPDRWVTMIDPEGHPFCFISWD